MSVSLCAICSGIPVAQQHLMYNLVELTNSANLSSYSIRDGSVLKLLVSLKNGLIADCGRTISTLDHIQWTELKYFINNRLDVLFPFCFCFVVSSSLLLCSAGKKLWNCCMLDIRV